jgi:hypothetical protein
MIGLLENGPYLGMEAVARTHQIKVVDGCTMERATNLKGKVTEKPDGIQLCLVMSGRPTA